MLQAFEEYIGSSVVNIPILGFILNLLLSALLANTLHWIYINYGNSLSNRKMFGKVFLLITMTTMLIITIVKSSLALSLGLVGALSIIRFRAAIKEPEELAYIFLAISVGLGFGADQRAITLLAFGIISTIIILGGKYSNHTVDHENLQFTVRCSKPTTINIEIILNLLKNHCNVVDLRRFDENPDNLEASFIVEAESFEKLLEFNS
jgi:hypothetical protein